MAQDGRNAPDRLFRSETAAASESRAIGDAASISRSSNLDRVNVEQGQMTKHYFLDPLAPFPGRWRDKTGPIKVMSGPVSGYVMCRRPGAYPFVLHVKHLCN